MEKMISLTIYMSSFIISILFCYIYQRNYKKKNYEELVWYKKFMWFLLIIFVPVIISTVRKDVGTDFSSYIEMFNSANAMSIEKALKVYGRESLYLLFNKTAFLLFKNSWGIFLISSFSIHIFTLYGIDYFKDHISMPFALFIFYMIHFSMGLNIIRQMIAVSIVFFSLRYIHKKEPIKYGIFIITAAMFHSSALICLVFYFISAFINDDNLNARRKSYRKLMYYWLVALSPFITFIGINLLVKMPVFGKYKTYISNVYEFSFSFLIEIIAILLPVLFYREKIKDNRINSFIEISLLNITFKGIISFASWGSRLSLYTNVFYYILPSILINSLDDKENRLLIKFYYIGFFILRYLLNHVFLYNTHEVYPYKTIFNLL